jgi:hypothetical protein
MRDSLLDNSDSFSYGTTDFGTLAFIGGDDSQVGFVDGEGVCVDGSLSWLAVSAIYVGGECEPEEPAHLVVGFQRYRQEMWYSLGGRSPSGNQQASSGDIVLLVL